MHKTPRRFSRGRSNTFGMKRLRAIREARGLTQAQLAALVGIAARCLVLKATGAIHRSLRPPLALTAIAYDPKSGPVRQRGSGP